MHFKCARKWLNTASKDAGGYVDASIHMNATLTADDESAVGCVTVVIERVADNEDGIEWLHLTMTPDNARNIAQMLHNTAQICDKLHERYS